MAIGDRPGESEYGGKGGMIQRAEDGHSSRAVDAADRQGVAEEAMVLRRAGKRTNTNPMQEVYVPGEGIQILKFPMTEDQARAELEERH